ncbi:MAG: 7-carboxy-7-deazaguanine synthase QueE [Planctomycetota bacterium]
MKKIALITNNELPTTRPVRKNINRDKDMNDKLNSNAELSNGMKMHQCLATAAHLVSVFSSIQGEGLYAGKPHLFIRFAGCNLRCYYCDTPESLIKPEYCKIEKSPFSKTYYHTINPIDSNYLLTKIKQLIKSFPYYHSIVLTGGEPLLHTPFLKEFLPHLRSILRNSTTAEKRQGFDRQAIMLETNGTLPKQLKEVLNLIDIISMDIKIASDVINPPQKLWQSTEKFLRISIRNQQTYIKIIITGSGGLKDFRKASQIIGSVNKHIPIILQPVSSVGGGSPPDRSRAGASGTGLREKGCIRQITGQQKVKIPSLKKLIKVYKIFSETVSDVRIIPQIHRLMKWE